jgi:hypothetical protein
MVDTSLNFNSIKFDTDAGFAWSHLKKWWNQAQMSVTKIHVHDQGNINFDKRYGKSNWV